MGKSVRRITSFFVDLLLFMCRLLYKHFLNRKRKRKLITMFISLLFFIIPSMYTICCLRLLMIMTIMIMTSLRAQKNFNDSINSICFSVFFFIYFLYYSLKYYGTCR